MYRQCLEIQDKHSQIDQLKIDFEQLAEKVAVLVTYLNSYKSLAPVSSSEGKDNICA